MARTDLRVKALHIASHGERTDHASSIVLTGDEVVDLGQGENRRLFRDLGVEVIFFSCCRLGADQGLMMRLVDTSGASAIFSYRHDVDDYEAFVIESLFHHLAYGFFRGSRRGSLTMPFAEVCERLKFSLDYLGIGKRRDGLVDPLLGAAFTRRGPSRPAKGRPLPVPTFR